MRKEKTFVVKNGCYKGEKSSSMGRFTKDIITKKRWNEIREEIMDRLMELNEELWEKSQREDHGHFDRDGQLYDIWEIKIKYVSMCDVEETLTFSLTPNGKGELFMESDL
jgi:hypothetical protein